MKEDINISIPLVDDEELDIEITTLQENLYHFSRCSDYAKTIGSIIVFMIFVCMIKVERYSTIIIFITGCMLLCSILILLYINKRIIEKKIFKLWTREKVENTITLIEFKYECNISYQGTKKLQSMCDDLNTFNEVFDEYLQEKLVTIKLLKSLYAIN